MKATRDCQCSDNCGTLIKKGDDVVRVKTYYDRAWHKEFRCLDCQYDRVSEEERENVLASLD